MDRRWQFLSPYVLYFDKSMYNRSKITIDLSLYLAHQFYCHTVRQFVPDKAVKIICFTVNAGQC